jgi:hypothetical protein
MSNYTPEYLYGNGDLIQSDTHRDLLRDLCNKLYKQFYPWRIRRFIVDNYMGQIYAMMVFSNKIYIDFRQEHTTGEYTIVSRNMLDKMQQCGRSRWEKTIDNDYIIEDLVTLMEQDDDYVKFMKELKRENVRDELLKNISIEVDYHPDSPVVDLLKSDFDSMK